MVFSNIWENGNNGEIKILKGKTKCENWGLLILNLHFALIFASITLTLSFPSNQINSGQSLLVLSQMHTCKHTQTSRQMETSSFVHLLAEKLNRWRLLLSAWCRSWWQWWLAAARSSFHKTPARCPQAWEAGGPGPPSAAPRRCWQLFKPAGYNL